MFSLVSWAMAALRYSLAIYLVLRAIFGPVLWPLCVIEPMLIWICLPSFALLAVALLRKRRAAALAHALISTTWLALFGHLLLPPTTPPAARGPTLQLVSFNVGAGVASFAEIVQLMRSESADVVVLQELTSDQEHAFANDLLELYPYRDLHGLGIDGLGLFSKFPILESELFRLRSRRPYQRALLDVRGERTTIFNVHPGLFRLLYAPWSPNSEDFARLASSVRKLSPAMIVGDLNATENMDLCVLLRAAGLHDAFRAAGDGFGLTFPVQGKYRDLPIPPVIRIDYVWHSDAYFCREARVLADAGSDHLPLRVVLERR